MRAAVVGLAALVWSAGCFAPDYDRKPCLGDWGCPADYVCLAGMCAERDYSVEGTDSNWLAVQHDTV